MSKKTTKPSKVATMKAAPTTKTKSVAKKTEPKKAAAPAKPKAPKKVAWPSGKNAFEKACVILGRKIVIPGVKGIPAKHANFLIAGLKLATIIEAVNYLVPEPSGVFPDYSKPQAKYWKWRYVKADAKHPGGVGFSYTFDDFTYAYAFVGSRFYFKTPSAREHLERPEFKQLWIDYLLIPNEK